MLSRFRLFHLHLLLHLLLLSCRIRGIRSLCSPIFLQRVESSSGIFHILRVKLLSSNYSRVKLAKHEDSKRSKGYAFIQYSSQDDAISAMEQMDQKRIGGRTIYAEIAKPVNNGFADYPITSGPPSGRNQKNDGFKDHPYEEDAVYSS